MIPLTKQHYMEKVMVTVCHSHDLTMLYKTLSFQTAVKDYPSDAEEASAHDVNCLWRTSCGQAAGDL